MGSRTSPPRSLGFHPCNFPLRCCVVSSLVSHSGAGKQGFQSTIFKGTSKAARSGKSYALHVAAAICGSADTSKQDSDRNSERAHRALPSECRARLRLQSLTYVAILSPDPTALSRRIGHCDKGTLRLPSPHLVSMPYSV